MKVLFALTFLALIWWLLRRTQKQQDQQPNDGPKPTKSGSSVNDEHMLPCMACGLHVPATEALQGRTGFYCCSAHLKASEG